MRIRGLPWTPTYEVMRRLLLVAGTIILVVLAGMMYARGVDPREVLGTLLFVPVFAAALFYGTWGGIGGGIAAALGYVALRWAAIDVVGLGALAGTIASRSVSYVVFGAISGWAIAQLEAPISKLERFDHIDDSTGLYNARFFLENTAIESARANRYNTSFSVVVVTIPEAALASMPTGARAATVDTLGQLMVARARIVDRVVHAADQERHLFALVLPETGADGARVLAEDLRERIVGALAIEGQDHTPPGSLEVRVVPGRDGSLAALRDEFVRLDLREHPAPERVRPQVSEERNREV